MNILTFCGLGIGSRRVGILLIFLLLLSTQAPRRVSCQLDDFRESAGKLFSSVKDTVKDNLGPAVKKVTETASDALDMAKRKVSEALGPDLSGNGDDRGRAPREGESCPAEGCPYDDNEDSGHSGYTPPPKGEDNGKEPSNREVAKVSDDDGGLLAKIFGSATTGLATVGRTLYDTLSDMSSRFADTVRKIMNEELYDLLAASAKKVGEAMFSPGATLFYLGESAASITLALSCLLLSYVFLYFFSIHFILTFLSGMFLLHQLLGPVELYKWIFFFGGHFVTFAKFAAKHYIITSVVIVLTFGYSFVIAIVKWTTQKSERQFREDLQATLLNQTVKIQELRAALENRIQTLEDNQNEILRTLQELRDAVRPPA